MTEEIKDEELGQELPAEEIKEEAPKKEKKDCKKHKKEIEELNAKLAEQEDKYLRVVAEYENFRRRAAAEKTAAYTDGLEGALEKLLPILDNLERAALYRDAERVAEGLAMTARSAADAFAALGVEAFGEVGDVFDPAVHNAVLHGEDDTHGEGEITEVHQKGYKKGDRILRYAMVTVAN